MRQSTSFKFDDVVATEKPTRGTITLKKPVGDAVSKVMTAEIGPPQVRTEVEAATVSCLSCHKSWRATRVGAGASRGVLGRAQHAE